MRLVIVEDEPTIRDGLASMISRMGADYSIEGLAGSIELGRELIRQTAPDIVLIALHIGRQSGLDLLRELRGQNMTARAVMLTNAGDFAYARHAQELGIDGFLSKPVRLDELKRVLGKASEMSRQETGADRLPPLSDVLKDYMVSRHEAQDILTDALGKYYRFPVTGEFGLLIVALPEPTREKIGAVRRIFERNFQRDDEMQVNFIAMEDKKQIWLVCRSRKPAINMLRKMQEEMVRDTCRLVHGPVIFVWYESESMSELKKKRKQTAEMLKWAFCFGRGEVLTEETVAAYSSARHKDIGSAAKTNEKAGSATKTNENAGSAAKTNENAGSAAKTNENAGSAAKTDKNIVSVEETSENDGSAGKEKAASFPRGMEHKARRLLREQDRDGLHKCCLRILYQLQNDPGDVEEMKGQLRRFYKTLFEDASSTAIPGACEEVIRHVDTAVSWYELAVMSGKAVQILLPRREKRDIHVSEITNKALMMIQKEYAAGLTLRQIAERLSVAPSHMQTLFKKETRQSIDDTIHRYRVRKIKELLMEEQLRVYEIAKQTGYSDVKEMNRIFREETGLQPNEYRQLMLR